MYNHEFKHGKVSSIEKGEKQETEGSSARGPSYVDHQREQGQDSRNEASQQDSEGGTGKIHELTSESQAEPAKPPLQQVQRGDYPSTRSQEGVDPKG